MSDLTERLLSLADCDARAGEPLGKAMRESAAENEALREVIAEAEKTMNGIADANWRKWGSETGPEDFVDWARSRARHTAGRISALSARQGEGSYSPGESNLGRSFAEKARRSVFSARQGEGET